MNTLAEATCDVSTWPQAAMTIAALAAFCFFIYCITR